MKTSKKILLSFCIYLLVVALVSALILIPYSAAQKEMIARREVAGTVDCAIFGASHALRGIDPSILNEQLGWNSYNYSNVLIKDYARAYLVEKELGRNPVKTVILDLTYNTLTRDQTQENGEGDAATVRLLESFPERLKYLLTNVKLDTILQVYGRQLVSSLNYWQAVLTGREYTQAGTAASNRGFYAIEKADVTLPADQLAEYRACDDYIGTTQEANLTAFRSIVEQCRASGARVIVLTLPISDALIWMEEDMDRFYTVAHRLMQELDVEFYDLNLLRDRTERFSDSFCFQDISHLSEEGSRIATEAFSELIQAVDSGENVSNRFFASYAEALEQLPYMQQFRQANS